MLQEIITKVYANNFIIILFIGGIGDYIFFHNVFPDNKMSLANIIIFGILIIITYTKFVKCNFIGIKKSTFHNCLLLEVHFTFYNDYQRQNPMTKKNGLLKYLRELNDKGLLSDNALTLVEEKIDWVNLMEIYYQIYRRNIQLHQHAISNMNKSNLARTLRKSLLKTNLRGNQEEKNKIKQIYDSQIYSFFQNPNVQNQPKDVPLDTILENDNEEQYDNKDKLLDSYNNPFGLNLVMASNIMDKNIYNNISMSTSIKKRFNNKDINQNNQINNEKNNDNMIKTSISF